MDIRYKTAADFYLFGRTPAAYPLGFPTVGAEQIPLLKKTGLDSIPRELERFDQPSRVADYSVTGVHFFSHDAKFQKIILHPERYVEEFSKFKVVLTPDSTLSPDMPPSVRIQNIRVSRQVGAIWESRGLKVIPSLRWSCREDYDIAFSGVELNSVVAVGTYGAIRNPNLREVLLDGLEELTLRLQPDALLLYGAIDQESLSALRKRTTVIQYFPHVWLKESKKDKKNDLESLFPWT